MEHETDWEALRAQLSQMYASPEYRKVHPLLDTAQSLVGARARGDVASRMIEAAKLISSDVESGRFTQPGWNVETVIQGTNINVNLDPVRNALDQIIRILSTNRRSIQVNVVLVIMTDEQARQLKTGQAFEADLALLQRDVMTLMQFLEQQPATNNWTTHYGAAPKDWRPFDEPALAARSIEEVIRQELSDMQDNLQLDLELVPEFHDIDALAVKADTVKRLMARGCLVVIDAVSLGHPQVLRDLQKTHLDVASRSSVFAMAPWDTARNMLEDMTYALQVKLKESALRWRIQSPFELAECHEISTANNYRFSRELIRSVTKLCDKQLQSNNVMAHINRG